MSFLVDSHCHLKSLKLEGKGANNFEDMLRRARYAQVTHMLCVACSINEFAQMEELTRPYNEIFLAVGMHPLNLKEDGEYKEEDFLELYQHYDKLIALGETGLDYFYEAETAREQQASFVRQIELAKAVRKPLIIHARNAHKDTVAIFKDTHAYDVGGIMHCYCDGVEMARECLDMGFYISFSGIATFKGSDNVREVINYVPDDRILVETDSPYLAPVPVRGVENEPAFVNYTLDFVAQHRGVSAAKLAQQTSHNFETLFNLKLSDYPLTPLPESDFPHYKLEKAHELDLKIA